MKLFIALATLVVLAAGQNTYTSENDDVAEALISNPETLKVLFNCLLDKGPCDKTQTFIKTFMPEAIQQACAKCSADQKVILKKFLAGLKDHYPADYEVYKQKFDPENKYFVPLYKVIA
ncbi:ejaculatory bulb-specific protein 3-like [Cydia strobilella]|uniref:ejaculatory bulb-specific protein 3-like n=1 Tax=Cydia strobilella TaxID=1100964 RepID=UPI0030064EEF